MKKTSEMQNKTEKTSSKKLGTFFHLFVSLIIILVIGVASATYAWIFSTYFSDITGINISIVDSQGLVMIINGEITQTIDINSYLGDAFSTFTLKESSSANGRDLFVRDMSTYYIDAEGLYDNIAVARDNIGIIKFRPAAVSDRNVNFIYFDFALQAAGEDRYLIFDSENSFLKFTNGTNINPIRVSLTFGEGEDAVTKIVGNRQEYFGNYYTQAVESIDSETKVGYTANQNVNSFEGYNGYNGSTFDESKTLFYLQNGMSINVSICIWLEGGDPQTQDSIAGTALDISLRFDNINASEVQP